MGPTQSYFSFSHIELVSVLWVSPWGEGASECLFFTGYEMASECLLVSVSTNNSVRPFSHLAAILSDSLLHTPCGREMRESKYIEESTFLVVKALKNRGLGLILKNMTQDFHLFVIFDEKNLIYNI